MKRLFYSIVLMAAAVIMAGCDMAGDFSDSSAKDKGTVEFEVSVGSGGRSILDCDSVKVFGLTSSGTVITGPTILETDGFKWYATSDPLADGNYVFHAYGYNWGDVMYYGYSSDITISGTGNATVNITTAAILDVTIAIGSPGPAGGWIFYNAGGGITEPVYLEAAPQSTEWAGIEWGKFGTAVDDGTPEGDIGTAIGTGAANTALIVAKLNEAPVDTGRAAQLADGLTHNDYGDWFLPSKDELNLMYTELKIPDVGGFASLNYWSSSEWDLDFAWYQDFDVVLFQNQGQKVSSIRVRAVRGFSPPM